MKSHVFFLFAFLMLSVGLMINACGNNSPSAANTQGGSSTATSTPIVPTNTPSGPTSTPTMTGTFTVTSTPTNTGTNTDTSTVTATPISPAYSSNWTYTSTSGGYYIAYSAYAGGRIYLADGGDAEVQAFTTSGGTAVAMGTAYLKGPVGIAADSSGNIYVSDVSYNNCQVYKMPASGAAAPVWQTATGYGSGNWAFNNPGQLGLDSSGNVYVSDRGNNRVEILNGVSGGYMSQWNGSPSHTWNGGGAFAIDAANGYVYIGASATTIMKFTTAGVYQTQWTGSLTNLVGLYVDPNTGNVLACDDGSYSMQIYSPSGTLLGSAGSYGYGAANAQFGSASPSGAAVDNSDNFYLVDYAVTEIKVFTP